MEFASRTFILLFLPLALAAYWIRYGRPQTRKIVLLLASLAFYVAADGRAVFILLLQVFYAFFVAKYLLHGQRRRATRIEFLLILINLLPLLLFKYTALGGGTGFNSAGWSIAGNGLRGSASLLLPLGISFYTFNLTGYLVDVSGGRIQPEQSLLEMANYATFFPTVSSGPLMRYRYFSSQNPDTGPSQTDISVGVFRVSMGIAKKAFIADIIGQTIGPLLASPSDLQFWGAWLAIVGFHFEVYYDFSAYTDIAIGVGRLFGYQIPENFNAPYTAVSFSDFWRRWHITLSEWFRDYFFVPFSRFLLRRSTGSNPGLTRTISLVLTMAMIGLWHGSRWTYVIFGVYHGSVMAIDALLRDRGVRPLPDWVSRPLTTVGLLIGWVIFQGTSLAAVREMGSAMLGLRGFEAGPLGVPGVHWSIVLLMLLLFAVTNRPRQVSNLRPSGGWEFATGLALMVAIWVLLAGQAFQFFYFQF